MSNISLPPSNSNIKSISQSLKLTSVKKTETKDTNTNNTETKNDSIEQKGIKRGVIKAVEKHITGKIGIANGDPSNSEYTFHIGKHKFTNIREVPTNDLEYAKVVTNDKNKIDEVFFKDLQNNKLYVAYGKEEDKGALGSIDDIEPKRRGYLNGRPVEVVHVNNETNTPAEGAKGPFKKTWKTLSEATEKGIASGIGAIATTGVGLYLGKHLFNGGMVQAASKVAPVVGSEIGKSTIKATLTSVGRVGLTVVGTVGAVALTLSAIGYLGARNPNTDYSTINEITDPNLFVKNKTQN